MSPTVRMLVNLAIAGVILGAVLWRLDINGWPSLLWVGAMIMTIIIRTPYQAETEKNVITDRPGMTTERILLFLVSLGTAILPLVHLLTGVFSFANYRLPDIFPIVAGLALIPAYYMFWRSHADLGKNWSVTLEVREGHGLITEGVYKYIRHPMYTSLMVVFFAQPFFVQNWIAGVAGPVAFLLLYLVRVGNEEAMMRAQFGAEYDAYCARSGRLLPRFRSASQA
ncbi:MAG: protein-S-isoprenylcysteine O-methyltransferase [Pseudomonadota bacterium]